MTVYRRKSSQPLKWLVALVVFGLALGITFTDVYGYNGSDKATDNTGQANADNSGSGGRVGAGTPVNDTPTAVPEPMTLILMAGGLSAMYAARRKKNRSK